LQNKESTNSGACNFGGMESPVNLKDIKTHAKAITFGGYCTQTVLE